MPVVKTNIAVSVLHQDITKDQTKYRVVVSFLKTASIMSKRRNKVLFV
jgi:hypothetical protein